MRIRWLQPEEHERAIGVLFGPRGLRRFLPAALRRRLRRRALLSALEQSAGVLSAEDYPEWDTSEDVAAWVRKLRKESDHLLEPINGR